MVIDSPRERAARARLEEPRRQLLVEAVLLARLETRMQRRQLHRHPGAPIERVDVHGSERTRRVADGVDRGHVALEVGVGILLGARALAQHVVGEQVSLVLVALGAHERFLDGAPEHELVAQHLHRLAHGLADHRLAGARDEPLDGVERVRPAR